MPAYFLDSSALVKAYRREIGTERVVELLAGADQLFIAELTPVEVSSALVRRGRDGAVAKHEMDAVLAQLDQDVSSIFQLINLSNVIIALAGKLARLHFLRAGDSIQLACAISARSQLFGGDFILVGSDKEMNSAAAAESFRVIDPTQT